MSTHRGLNKIPGTFDGLGNYIQAISDFTYLFGFWGAHILVIIALRAVGRGATARQLSLAGRSCAIAISAARNGRMTHRPAPRATGPGRVVLAARAAGGVGFLSL